MLDKKLLKSNEKGEATLYVRRIIQTLDDKYGQTVPIVLVRNNREITLAMELKYSEVKEAKTLLKFVQYFISY